MNILLVNGSPHREGCTNEALSIVAETIRQEGGTAQIYWIGNRAIQGCIGCYKCKDLHRCVFDDQVNPFVERAAVYDGFIFATPVYYSGISGGMKCFMDRVFFSATSALPANPFLFKPAAGVVSARRAGTTPVLDQLQKYFLHDQMPVIGSTYWNMVHGQKPEDVRKDAEGTQVMRALGRNFVWFLKLKKAGEQAGVSIPMQEVRTPTNFIRD